MSVQVRLRVASETYAMPDEPVLEVAVRNLRGRILPVVDLALLLQIPRTAPPGRLLVAEAGGRRAGFAIDEVSEVGELPDPAEETESGLLVGALFGEGNLIGVIDVPRVFDALVQVPR